MSGFNFRKQWCSERLPADLAHSLVHEPETLLSRVSQTYKADKKTQVYQLNIQGQYYCLKVYPLRNYWQRLRQIFFQHRAQRNVVYAQRCQHWNIPTFEALGYAYVNQTYYLLTTDIPGQTALDVFGYHAQRHPHWPEYAEQMIQIILRLRAHRHIHHDMNLSNFKIDNDRVYLLDLDGMRPFAWYDKNAATKDADRFLENWDEDQYAHPEALTYFQGRFQ